MRAKSCLFAALLLILALAGCKKPASVVGTWKIVGLDRTQTFDPGGTYTVNDSNRGIDTTVKGTYTLTDKVLTTTDNDIKASARLAELQHLIPAIQKSDDIHKGKPQTQLISWKGDDTFALFAPDDTAFKNPHGIFVRQK
ncbi:MAG TPA: hypothetical protein VGL56_06520 [Fimbriimonadaceae bacterium]|jgi:hypothetical protein